LKQRERTGAKYFVTSTEMGMNFVQRRLRSLPMNPILQFLQWVSQVRFVTILLMLSGPTAGLAQTAAPIDQLRFTALSRAENVLQPSRR
jgi:hypothetical protein